MAAVLPWSSRERCVEGEGGGQMVCRHDTIGEVLYGGMVLYANMVLFMCGDPL